MSDRKGRRGGGQPQRWPIDQDLTDFARERTGVLGIVVRRGDPLAPDEPVPGGVGIHVQSGAKNCLRYMTRLEVESSTVDVVKYHAAGAADLVSRL